MTSAAARMVLIALGLLLVLTYLLLRGFTPDPQLQERRLRAIDAVTLNEAALHRDVLKASHGLMLNYDPLVATVNRLRAVAAQLRAGGAPAPLIDGIAAELDRQESLVEDFKSVHALLRNSVSYFAYLGDRLVKPTTESGRAVAMVVGKLVSAMFRFVDSTSTEAEAAELAAAMDELSAQPAPDELHEDLVALHAHGALILKNQPLVAGILSRLLATRVSEQARGLQDHFMAEQRRAESLAWIFRLLLYAASVLLLVYLSYLYMRLRANARALRARSDFEHLIAGISGQLIDTPVERVADVVRQGVEHLGRHVGVDRAYLILHGSDHDGAVECYAWSREGLDPPDGWPDAALALARDCELELCQGSKRALDPRERYGCLEVSSVAAPPRSDEKERLSALGVRAWLCVPLWHAGAGVGVLGFDAVTGDKRWSNDDIPLLRTIGEILVNALFRGRTERERLALESRLRHAQRLESLGTLAGGIAHDFNNILGAILGYSEMLLSRLRGKSRDWQHIQEVKKAAERARDIVDGILAFSRRTDQRLRPVRLCPLLEETAGLLRASLPATIDLRLHLPDGDPVLWGEPGRLQQVVMNLATNAAQAMEGKGVVDLSVDLVALEAGQALSHGTLTVGRYVRLRVRDNGLGMNEAILERIFEPFFTTKPIGAGTGLGLAMVHGIVADHGGGIDVRSQPGAGSSFEVYFPQYEGPPIEDPADKTLPIGNGETILIVDDDNALVKLGEEMVAALGYEAVGFDNSMRALAVFRADRSRFDLVLADEIMPEMTGTELAAAIHEMRPEIPVILMTGHGGALDVIRPGVREILRKPLLSSDIATAIARQLHLEGPAPAA